MTKKLNLVIEGMHCNSCASKVENALKQIENISNISINVNSGIVEAEVDETTNEKTVRRIIDKAGYSLVDFK